MLIVKILLSFIIGIVLAEADTVFVPLLLCVSAVIMYLLAERLRNYAFLTLVATFSCLMAWHDKMTSDAEDYGNRYPVVCEYISKRIDKLEMRPASKALSKALIMGERGDIDKDLIQNVRNAGMSHVMAVSGMHVGIIYVIIHLLLKILCVGYFLKTRRVVVMVIIWGYVLSIGCPLSAIRAVLMLTISEISWWSERSSTGMPVLASSAMIMLLYDTQQLWDVGFQLSFIATWGIIMFLPILRQTKSIIVQLLMTTLSAQVATLPLVAYYFHVVPLFGWLQGLLIVPMMPVLMYSLIIVIIFPIFTQLSFIIDILSRLFFFVAIYVSDVETWCLGGKLLWYPSLAEVVLMQTIVVILIIYVRNLLADSKKNSIFA